MPWTEESSAACFPGCGSCWDPSGWFLPCAQGYPNGVGTGGAGAVARWWSWAQGRTLVMILCWPDTPHFPQTPGFPLGDSGPPVTSVLVTEAFLGSGFYFGPFPGPTDEAVPGGTVCFLGNHNVEKVNFLSMWPPPRRLFIFGAVVIARVKGSTTVAALPWLGQLNGRRNGGTDTELLPPARHDWYGCAPSIAACPARLREALASHRKKCPIPSQPGPG